MNFLPSNYSNSSAFISFLRAHALINHPWQDLCFFPICSFFHPPSEKHPPLFEWAACWRQLAQPLGLTESVRFNKERRCRCYLQKLQDNGLVCAVRTGLQLPPVFWLRKRTQRWGWEGRQSTVGPVLDGVLGVCALGCQSVSHGATRPDEQMSECGRVPERHHKLGLVWRARQQTRLNQFGLEEAAGNNKQVTQWKEETQTTTRRRIKIDQIRSATTKQNKTDVFKLVEARWPQSPPATIWRSGEELLSFK